MLFSHRFFSILLLILLFITTCLSNDWSAIIGSRVPYYARHRIVSLRCQHQFSFVLIANILAKEGFSITVKTVRCIYNRWKEMSNFVDKQRSGQPSKIPYGVRHFIDHCMTRDNELTARHLCSLIGKRFTHSDGMPKLTISERTVQRLRKSLGWTYANIKYCQMIRLANRPKRVEFCEEMLCSGEKFENVLFTDECTVQLERHKRKAFVKNGHKHMVLRSKAKHPVKVHIWAGISWQGATKIVIFNGKCRMNSELFCRVIKEVYVPFAKKTYDAIKNCHLQMDNAPFHTSKFTRIYLTDEEIQTIAWPPESPDLNVIELVWHQLKEYLRSTTKPANLSELKAGIKQFWHEKITKKQCQNYINHIHNAMPKVIAAKGG